MTPQLQLELSQITEPRLVEQPASVTEVPVVQEEQPGLDAVHGAGSVINLAQQDMILTDPYCGSRQFSVLSRFRSILVPLWQGVHKLT